MVYVGPSTGCYLCRKRKIKCSEEKPGCRNCAIYGRPCPGYRSDGVFRNETQKVGKLVKKTGSSALAKNPVAGRRLLEVSSTTTTAAAAAAAAATSKAGDSTNSPLSLYRVADSTWEERAVCYFFDQYTTAGKSDDCVSHLEFLPALYAKCRENGVSDAPSSCLRWAVDASALIALGHETKAQALTLKARRSYGMALRELRQLLQSPAQAVKDQTFAAVVLLSLFEDISGERNGLCSSHTAGLELLMRLRGEAQLGHQQGRDLFAYAYAHTHIEILALGDKPQFNTEWIIGALSGDDPVHRLMLTSSKISQLFLKASSAQSQMQGQEIPPGLVKAFLLGWIEHGKVLDLELTRWSQNLPDHWLPLVVHAGEPLIAYQRISIATIWNYYRAVRIVMQRILLELRRALALLLVPGNNNNNAEIAAGFDDSAEQVVIQEMITDICRSLPFSLGNVDSLGRRTTTSSKHAATPLDQEKPRIKAVHGYSSLWPLWYVLSCGLATPTQASQVRSALARLGSGLGIRLASILAEAEG